MQPLRSLAPLLALVLVGGCSTEVPQALGTLEFDRITLPAPAAERIVEIDVREGEVVVEGQRLLQLDTTRTQAQLAALVAEAERARDRLSELQAGPRSEAIAAARANLAANEARAREATAYYERLLPLKDKAHVAAADLDRARAAMRSAAAQASATRAALDELLHGTRAEQLRQAEASLAAAEAQADAQRVLLGKLALVAPRAARVDSLPYRLGDQAPPGAPLAILLAGDTPYARIYVPEALREQVKVGDPLKVFVGTRAQAYEGRLRMIRSEPVFTPYYALIGADVARLSWLAEVELGADAAELPAGMPVRIEFAGATR
ncbi:MAG: HlyD family efflux transporter periplasmic adaptor subunit [Lysobacteraceae bacterium]|nr:MAG: HlyD family efflux transporter periplasmic adaptor subunit [Xanthomonadaceae bacterium]